MHRMVAKHCRNPWHLEIEIENVDDLLDKLFLVSLIMEGTNSS